MLASLRVAPLPLRAFDGAASLRDAASRSGRGNDQRPIEQGNTPFYRLGICTTSNRQNLGSIYDVSRLRPRGPALGLLARQQVSCPAGARSGQTVIEATRSTLVIDDT